MVLDTDFSWKLYHDYLRYREPSFLSNKVKHSGVLPLINRLQNKDIFTVRKVGESEEGRSINLISCGSGTTKIFLWSQMHGDESTATMAVFDILNFLSSDDDFNPCRKRFLRKLTLYFMPMVNPDGAELFQRENAMNIDINRDLQRKQSAEGRILFDAFNEIKPDFGFNLHDQDRIYTAGLSNNTSALSFLAPAYNYGRDVNRVRSRAMKLVAKINEIVSQFIPGHTAKYSDEFEPRAFGDNFQKLGTSTILIESGNWIEDENKNFIRKLNFISLLYAFKSISEGSYRKAELDSYWNIPNNEKFMMDLVLRNAEYQKENKSYKLDIGISRKEVRQNGSGKIYFKSNIEEIGDLSVFQGYEDYDLEGYTIHQGKIYPTEFNSIEELEKLNFAELYGQGYLFVKLKQTGIVGKNVSLPINISINGNLAQSDFLKSGIPSNFYIAKKDEIRYIILNGFFHNLRSGKGEIKNGLMV